jgi:hypothetical protein
MDSFPVCGSPAQHIITLLAVRPRSAQSAALSSAANVAAAHQYAVHPHRAQSAPVSAAQTHFTSTLVIVYRARDFVNGRGEVLAHFFVTRLCRSEWDLL